MTWQLLNCSLCVFLHPVFPWRSPSQTLSRVDPFELQSSDELIAWGGVSFKTAVQRSRSVTEESAGVYLCLHVIHTFLLYGPTFLQGVTQIHILFLCVTVCILISALADRGFNNNQKAPQWVYTYSLWKKMTVLIQVKVHYFLLRLILYFVCSYYH